MTNQDMTKFHKSPQAQEWLAERVVRTLCYNLQPPSAYGFSSYLELRNAIYDCKSESEVEELMNFDGKYGSGIASRHAGTESHQEEMDYIEAEHFYLIESLKSHPTVLETLL